MNDPASISDSAVAGGESRERKRARFFSVMALLWIFPSVGSLWIIARDSARLLEADGWLESIGSIAFEQWIALGELGLHAACVVLAVYYRRQVRLDSISPGRLPTSD